jgi:YVTN family beta-propeller protein
MYLKLIKNLAIPGISIISLTIVSVIPVFDVPFASADECYSIVTGSNTNQSTLVGTKLYTNDKDSDTVTIIDTTTNAGVGSIEINDPIFSTLIGTNLYVNSFSDNQVQIINTTTDTIDPGPIGVGDEPIFSIAVGTNLYVVNGNSANVSVIDTLLDTYNTISVASNPRYAVLVETNLYVISSDAITIIDTETNTVIDTIESLGAGLSSATLVGSNLLYITSSIIGNLYTLDTDTNILTAVGGPGSSRTSKLIDGYLYLTNSVNDTVVVVDTATNLTEALIPVGDFPTAMAVANGKLYVTNLFDNTVSVIDTTSKTKLTDISVGDIPKYVISIGDNVYVNNNESVSVIDTNTDKVISVPCPLLPTIVNLPATSITQTSAILNGEIIDIGSGPVTVRYFLVVKAADFNGGNPDPENLIAAPPAPVGGSYGIGEFSTTVTDLTCGTDYLYIMLAENAFGEAVAFDPVGELTTLPCSDDSPTPPVYVSSSSGYSPLLAWNPTPSTSPTPSLGTPGACAANQIITQNLRAPSRNGIYDRYTKGIVKEAKILQAHLNRLGFNSGTEDGILGPISIGAIKRMQTFLKTTPDGYVGPITRGLINNSCGSEGLNN